jgi:nitric oxide reductase subunit B
MNLIRWIDQRKHWWKVFLLIFVVSVTVVLFIGYSTYQSAPPYCDFRDQQGNLVFTRANIEDGQLAFKRNALMDYGSYLGDGGLRGPDYSAEALHLTTLYMIDFYDQQKKTTIPDDDERHTVVEALVKKELKKNHYQPDPDHPNDRTRGHVVLSPAQVHAYRKLEQYYLQKFRGGGELTRDVFAKEFPNLATPADEAATASHSLSEQDIQNLTAFFFRGGWVGSAVRPGADHSYTHNWPYDPLAGNVPHGELVFWSVIGTLVVILFLGIIFYYYGKLDREAVLEAQNARMPPLATTEAVSQFKPTPTQRATYKFFGVAALLFLVQVVAGLLAIADFVNLFAYLGLDQSVRAVLPTMITRAWHTQISVLWIAVCWFAATIWVLPLICRPEPSGQLRWINTLFGMLLVVAVGGALGIPLGVHGFLKESGLWLWLCLQGWEFMQIGVLYQYILYAAFVVWLVIVARGLWPVLRQKQTWSLPNWMVYAIAGIIFMFSAGFVAGPKEDFVIGDFWRWCTIHMWVEAFFELFTTIIVAYFLYLMGFVSHAVAARVVYLGAVLFLGSGLIGISHNFYWNAKSIWAVALGASFSSLQVAPLVLLTVEAWRFRHMPEQTLARLNKASGTKATFGLTEAFLFLVGVNFWNFVGAGVLGFMINLPIINYYEHGTYLTIAHGHAALFGVYGNLAIAAMIFCGRWLVGAERWRPRLLRFSFWAMNVGVALMLVLHLFPLGVHQLLEVMSKGYAYGRSQSYLLSEPFQTMTWLRGIGTGVFLCGMLPLVWFVVSRWFSLKGAQKAEEQFVVPATVLAVAGHGFTGNGNGNGNGAVTPRTTEEEEVAI